MKFCLMLNFISCIFSGASASLFEGFLRQRVACFPVKYSPPQCSETLVESYQPSIETALGSKPRTLVYLFTPTSPDIAEQLHLCGGWLPPDSTYDSEADTEIFIHGWLDGLCRTSWMREMKERLFARGKYNVILVDWTWGNGPVRRVIVKNSRVVGEQIGFIVKNIMKQTGVGPEKFHVIGHSRGTIVAGYIGRAVKNLRRITALDPPYEEFPPEERITYRDAKIVDIIHTNGATNYATHYGDIRQLGHADFYPNGGAYQTSCYSAMMEAFMKGDFVYVFGCLSPRFCNHLQAVQFYKASINPGNCQFVGRKSDSYEEFLLTTATNRYEWAVMGMDYEKYHSTNDTNRRKYYLKTSNYYPYCDDSYLGGKKFPFETSCRAK